MQNYKLEELQLGDEFKLLPTRVTLAELQDAISAFVMNVKRIDELAGLPAGLFYWASVLGHNGAAALHKRLNVNV